LRIAKVNLVTGTQDPAPTLLADVIVSEGPVKNVTAGGRRAWAFAAASRRPPTPSWPPSRPTPPTGVHQGADRQRRPHLRRRCRHRRQDRRGHGRRGQRRRHLRGGVPDHLRHRHGHRRGHAVRARLHLAVHGHRHGEDGGRAQRSLHPAHRPEGHQHPGHGAAAGGDHARPVARCSSWPRTSRARRRSTILLNKSARHARTCVAIKAPGFGDRRKRILEDIAAVTGAQVIDKDFGMTMADARIDMLGHAKTVKVTKDSAPHRGRRRRQEAIDDRIGQIKAELEPRRPDFDREKRP
ncbi:MAG: hypothetical protein ACLTDR_15945, partial [Adlercreutzia equolifaciens]